MNPIGGSGHTVSGSEHAARVILPAERAPDEPNAHMP